MATDITNSHQIIKAVVSYLFEAEFRRLQKWTEKLCEKQTLARGDPMSLGFLYGGEFHRPEWLPGGRWPRQALHETLRSEMEAFLRDRAIIRDHQQLISQTLFAMVRNCGTQQELRDALPDCLISIIPELSRIERVETVEFKISGNDRAYRQYLKALPLMENYSATRLIF